MLPTLSVSSVTGGRRGNAEGPGPAASNGLYLRSPPPGEKSDNLMKLPVLFSLQRCSADEEEEKDVSRRGKDRPVQVWSEATCEE